MNQRPAPRPAADYMYDDEGDVLARGSGWPHRLCAAC